MRMDSYHHTEEQKRRIDEIHARPFRIPPSDHIAYLVTIIIAGGFALLFWPVNAFLGLVCGIACVWSTWAYIRIARRR